MYIYQCPPYPKKKKNPAVEKKKNQINPTRTSCISDADNKQGVKVKEKEHTSKKKSKEI